MTPRTKPNLLVLETSGRVGLVALAQGERLLRTRRLDESRRHARDLAPAVAELLAAEGWRPRDLQAVLVSRGPGSYTGLRVGIMSAKTLAYATGCALIAVETFEVLAWQTPAEAAVVYVLDDAQQDRLYVQKFARTAASGEWTAASDLTISPVAEWLARREETAWSIGPGLRLLGARLPAEARFPDPKLWNPTAEGLLFRGLAHYQAGRRDDLWTLEPLYARASSAEEKWSGDPKGNASPRSPSDRR